jgi:desulfoferrodoxin (superoxide reductase-like protein)
MNNDKTIVYYTANTEEPAFEQRIIDDLKIKAGDMPIISVSRKPIDLGTNICVGEVPHSYTSEWKQLLIGLKAAKTKFVIAAESDCLYPPEYFSFIPLEEKTMYNYNNIYIIWKYKNGIYKKTGYCEGAQICDREYWIERLEPLLPKDWVPYTRDEESKLVKMIFQKRKEFTGNPVISFKTRDGVSYRTTFINNKLKELPYWGTIKQLRTKFL